MNDVFVLEDWDMADLGDGDRAEMFNMIVVQHIPRSGFHKFISRNIPISTFSHVPIFQNPI